MTETLRNTIEDAWENRDRIGAADRDAAQAVEAALALLDSGEARVAEKSDSGWTVNQWLKKAVLLSFRLSPMEAITGEEGA